MVLTSRKSGCRGMLALLALAAASAGAARAETAPPAGEAANGRFTMTPVADGFLRLDTRSGQVSLCTLAAGQAQCRAGADERAALEAEIDRLSKENAALKGQKSDVGKSAQEDEDRRFDRALDRAERFMRRMMQLFRESDGKSPPGSL